MFIKVNRQVYQERKTKQFAAASVTGGIITGLPDSVVQVSRYTAFWSFPVHT